MKCVIILNNSIISHIHSIDKGDVSMEKLKNSLSRGYLKWRYSKETEPELFRIGIRIGFGLMCVIAAIALFFN